MLSTKRFISPAFASILALTGALALAGCPGSIPVEDRARFVGGNSCGIALESVPSTILVQRCATSACHDTSSRAGGLDLASPNVASRLLGVQSATCTGHTLLVAGDVSHSFFFQKLNPNPACGTQMPNGMPPLSAADLACIQAWLRSVGGGTDGGVDVVPPTDVPVGVDTPMPMDVQMPMDTPMPTDTGNDVRVDTGNDTAMPMDVQMPMDAAMDVPDDTSTTPDTGTDTAADDTSTVDTASTDESV